MDIRIIDKAHEKDINIKNEFFKLYGKMLPSYVDDKWSYTTILLEPQNVTKMRFPDENYDYDKMSENSVFIGAYQNGECIGLAIMQEGFLKYMYLYDLKVNSNYRGKGIARALIEKAKLVAASKNYRGIYTQAQDNNLNACMFYINAGFRIGGIDTEVYKGTVQEGKSDILFYLDIV